MSHIVIHDDSNDRTHYAEFDGLEPAVAYLEDLVNAQGESNARLFSLAPVEFAVKSYVRIEIAAEDSQEDGPEEATLPDAEFDEAEPTEDRAENETVEYVEVAAAPADPFAPVDDLGGLDEFDEFDDLDNLDERDDGAPAGDSRRGLFGR